MPRTTKNPTRSAAKKPTFKISGGPPSLVLLFALLLPLACWANALKDSPSPYLALHGDDPVDWHNWSAQVLRQAQAQNKLIFISSGYFSCYWCHRMHQDVYLHPDAAAELNRLTVPVKIDRELNPALDTYLINFARRTTGRAGWPIHVLLTPDGLPFYAFMYQPKDRFITIIQRAARLWRQQPERIRMAARKALPQPTAYDPKARPSLTQSAFKQQFLNALRAQMDDFSGGLKGQQKFPETPLLLNVFRFEHLPSDIQDWFNLTLEAMAQQHLRDHVDGGFFRYTVDPAWHTPHYEKMLYDNAQLAELYLRAGKRFHRSDWITVGLETLDFIQRRLYNPQTGLYVGSLSAVDAHHEEGGNYLLSAEQLRKRLTPEQYQLVSRHWQLDQPGPWEGKWLPEPFVDPRWPAIRQRLRQAFTPPARDDKQMLGWNALLINAFVAAAEVTGDERWHQRAEQLFNQLNQLISQPQAPRALSRTGHPIGQASLEDHALLLRAAQALNQDTRSLQRLSEQRFLTPVGWKLSIAPLLPGMGGVKWLPDDALPSLTALLDARAPNRLAAAEPTIRQAPLTSGSYLWHWPQALAQINAAKTDSTGSTAPH